MVNILSNVYVIETSMHYGTQEACIWFLLPLLAIVTYIVIEIASSPSEKTVNIAILGSIGSGKTTLWKKLRNEIPSASHVYTGEDLIESFKIKVGDKEVKVSATKDFGGGDKWVSYYDELIKEGTFVYFLVDMTRLESKKMEIRSRIQKISKIITDNNYKNCGIKLLATHYDEYSLRNNSCTKGQASGYVKQTLDTKSIKDVTINVEDCIVPVNLLLDLDIELIKKEILNIFNYE